MTGTAPPLEGLTIPEIFSSIAAPLGGLTPAQLGADVIRIDPIGGGADLGRWPLAPSGASPYPTGLNKGKKSLTLNFRDSEGRGILADLVAPPGPGGIVLTNAAGQDWLVDVYVLEEKLRSLAWLAAWSADVDTASARLYGSAAGAYARDAFERAAEMLIHVHDGIGFTWEPGARLYWWRPMTAMTGRFLLGPARKHRAAVACLVMGGSADA